MQNTQFVNRQSSSRSVARQVAPLSSRPAPQSPAVPRQATTAAPSEKQVTIRALTELKRRLYARAAHAIQQHPEKAEIIQKAVDRDASHIAFVINMVSVKL